MTWTTERASGSSGARAAEPPAFDARAAAAQVAADMNAAFAPWIDLGPGAAARGVRRLRFGPGEAGGSPKRGRLNLVAAVSVGVLVGVSVGALLARPHRAQAPSQPALADTAPPLALSAAIGSTPPRRLRIETEPSPTIQPPRLAQASSPVRAASTAALGEIGAKPEPYTADGSWSGRRYLAWNAPSPRTVVADATSEAYPRAGWSTQRVVAPPTPTASARPDCSGQAGWHRHDCLIAASGRADAALRASYRQAAMAGVPNEVLEQDTQSWNDLRWRGGGEPEQMIAGYRRLTATLRAQAAAARRDRFTQDRGEGWPGQPYPPPYSPWD